MDIHVLRRISNHLAGMLLMTMTALESELEASKPMPHETNELHAYISSDLGEAAVIMRALSAKLKARIEAYDAAVASIKA